MCCFLVFFLEIVRDVSEIVIAVYLLVEFATSLDIACFEKASGYGLDSLYSFLFLLQRQSIHAW